MPKDEQSFNERLRFINNDFTFDPNMSKFSLQKNILNSQAHNDDMATIEKELNLLYEKSRVLEDLSNYTKAFLENQLHIYHSKIRDTLKIVEESRDSLKNSSYISYIVPFVEGDSTFMKDRNGSNLDQCDLYDGTLIISGNDLESVNIVEATKKQQFVAYNDNLKDIIDQKPYRSFYFLDGPARHGIIEEITVLFEKPIEVNFIDILPSNCEIVSINMIGEHGATVQIHDVKNKYTPPIKTRGAAITIRAINYQKETYEIDTRRIKTGFWRQVEAHLYNISLNRSSTFNLEEQSGLLQYERDFEQYLSDLKIWEEEKEAVERTNQLRLGKWELHKRLGT